MTHLTPICLPGQHKLGGNRPCRIEFFEGEGVYDPSGCYNELNCEPTLARLRGQPNRTREIRRVCKEIVRVGYQ